MGINSVLAAPRPMGSTILEEKSQPGHAHRNSGDKLYSSRAGIRSPICAQQPSRSHYRSLFSQESKATNQQERMFSQPSLAPAPQTISIAMKRPKNLIQTKITIPEKEIDLTNLTEKEFKIKIINMLTELQVNIQELRDEVKREITEVKQSLEGFISRMDKMQEAIDGIETREQERIDADAERDKRISRNETTLREICDQYRNKTISGRI